MQFIIENKSIAGADRKIRFIYANDFSMICPIDQIAAAQMTEYMRTSAFATAVMVEILQIKNMKFSVE